MTNHLFSLAALGLCVLLFVGCATTRGAAGGAAIDPALGQPPPAIELIDLKSGDAVSLARTEGRVVLLDFWATWCTPCMKSLPVYELWQRELGEQGFSVVAVSVDVVGAPVGEFAARLAPSVQVLLDPEGLAPSALALEGLPVAFVVGRDGLIRSRHLGFHTADEAALRAEIEALLGEPAPSE